MEGLVGAGGQGTPTHEARLRVVARAVGAVEIQAPFIPGMDGVHLHGYDGDTHLRRPDFMLCVHLGSMLEVRVPGKSRLWRMVVAGCTAARAQVKDTRRLRPTPQGLLDLQRFLPARSRRVTPRQSVLWV